MVEVVPMLTSAEEGEEGAVDAFGGNGAVTDDGAEGLSDLVSRLEEEGRRAYLRKHGEHDEEDDAGKGREEPENGSARASARRERGRSEQLTAIQRPA